MNHTELNSNMFLHFHTNLVILNHCDVSQMILSAGVQLETCHTIKVYLFTHLWKSPPMLIYATIYQLNCTTSLNSQFLCAELIWGNIEICLHFIVFLDTKEVKEGCRGTGKLMRWSPFYWHGLTLISAWISNHMPNKSRDEITYPFANFNGATVEVWEWLSNFTPYFVMDMST